MADDITLPGPGAVVATEESGGKHFQKVAIVDDSFAQVNPATEENQTTLNSLIDTLQELCQRLAPIAALISSGAPYLRVTGPVTATGGGYITSAQAVAALLTLEKALERYSANHVHSNINNVTPG